MTTVSLAAFRFSLRLKGPVDCYHCYYGYHTADKVHSVKYNVATWQIDLINNIILEGCPMWEDVIMT